MISNDSLNSAPHNAKMMSDSMTTVTPRSQRQPATSCDIQRSLQTPISDEFFCNANAAELGRIAMHLGTPKNGRSNGRHAIKSSFADSGQCSTTDSKRFNGQLSDRRVPILGVCFCFDRRKIIPTKNFLAHHSLCSRFVDRVRIRKIIKCWN